MPQSDDLEPRAYREAGHATMSYLIRNGFIENYVPLYDRWLILPEFSAVSIEGPSADWNKPTFSLGSLLPSVQVELAGHVAEQIKFDSSLDTGFSRAMLVVAGYFDDQKSIGKAIQNPHLPPDPPPARPYMPLVLNAFHGIEGTVEQYMPESSMDYDERTRRSVQIFQDMYPYLVDRLRLHWPAVEALAQALLQHKTLSEAEAFQVLEPAISDEAKAEAQAFLALSRERRGK